MTCLYLIRKALPSEAPVLTQIALRSKAYWGYSRELIETWHAELEVTPDLITQGISYVAEFASTIKGFWCRPATEELSEGRLFIEPEAIGSGCGRALWQAVIAEAKARGLRYMTWLSDPNAIGFYQKMGAKQIDAIASDIIPGRQLPVMQYHLR